METKTTNPIALLFIEMGLKILTSGKIVSLVKDLVMVAEKEDKTGTEKHQEVFDKLLSFGYDLGETLMDVLIKVGVMWLNNKIAKDNT